MPNYDIQCSVCGYTWEVFQAMSAPTPDCPKCGGKGEKLMSNTIPAMWYCDCPTASHGCVGNASRPYGFVDDSGREHKIKYHHGTPVKNRYKSGAYCGEHNGEYRTKGDK